ncbi:MAG TPA: lysylphosphatidylglycerol synthase transmembrane domain-containing protein [Chloroflexota bacterium]|nr:lysylphosphatidylglycerol synthase transmembrane domain-containing protein [Chloroflexota bacterium]
MTTEAPISEAEVARPPSLGKRFFNLRTLLSFALGFAILGFLATRVQIDVGAILGWVRQANPWLLVLAFLAFYATFPIRALRWRRLLDNVELTTHEEGGGRLGIPVLSEIIFLGWFANCIVPAKLGDAYRAYLLKLNAGVSFSTTVGTILAERIIDVVVLFVLMLGATGLSFGRAVPGEVLVLMQIGLALVVLVVIGLIGMRRLRPLVERVLPPRFHAQYARFEHGTLGSFRGIPGLVALTGAAWAGEVARMYLVTLSLGLGGIAPSVVVFVALAAALMTTLPLTPAGLGFAEGAIVGVLLLAAKAGLAPGVDEHAAASIALLDRGISYWSLIAVGLVVYPLSKRK